VLAIVTKHTYKIESRIGGIMKQYNTPGQLISELLDRNGWSQRTLAIVIGKSESTINKIISGKGAVTTELALALEDVFGENANTFLELQNSYDLQIARITNKPDPTRATRAHIFGNLPVYEMIRRGWIFVEDETDLKAVEAAIVKFFGASRPEEIHQLPIAAKKTDAEAPLSLTQLAWLYRVRQIALEMVVHKYTKEKLKIAIEELSKLTKSAEEARKVPRILAECGVRFLLVETLPNAKIDGVCFWLNDNSPVVALTMRHDRIDNFWFVLRHELEHVLQGHGKHSINIDIELEGDKVGHGQDIPQEERLANEAASSFCVSPTMIEAFIARKAPFFSERDLLGFSKTIGVHPGIVAGQLQNRTGRYDRFRKHLVKIRNIVASNAFVDGWGDIAPLYE